MSLDCSRHKRVSPKMTLPAVRNHLQAARGCLCLHCRRFIPRLLDRLETLEAEPAPPDASLDPVMLMGGIKAAPMSKSMQKSLAMRAFYAAHLELAQANGRRLARNMTRRTVENVTREQNRLDRLFSVTRGHVYRG